MQTEIRNLRVFIQDNGLSNQIYPKEAEIYNENGETEIFDFKFRDRPPVGWKVGTCKPNSYIEKQPHFAVILDEELDLNSLSLKDRFPPAVKALLSQKFMGIPVSKLCVVKVINAHETYNGGMLKLNSVCDVVCVYEEAPEIQEQSEIDLDLLLYLPTFHVMERTETSIPATVQFNELEESAPTLRTELIKTLKSSFGGDLLAAEYAAAQLFHSTRKRVGGVPSTTFSLNVFHQEISVIDIQKCISFLWPFIKPIQFDVNTMNESKMQPFQSADNDYGLCTGALQMPDHTFFIVDESKLNEGQLSEKGYKNFVALQRAIDSQSVAYEIPYGSFESECDFNFLVVGTSTSLLKTNFVLPVVPSTVGNEKVGTPLPHLTSYIAARKNAEYSITEEMETLIHDDFVKTQKEARENGKPADDGTKLLLKMILAECLCRSYGKTTLTEEIWEKAKNMESERLSRLKN